MITRNQDGQLTITDTEGHFATPEAQQALLFDLIDALQCAAQDGMMLPHLHALLHLFIPSLPKLRALVHKMAPYEKPEALEDFVRDVESHGHEDDDDDELLIIEDEEFDEGGTVDDLPY